MCIIFLQNGHKCQKYIFSVHHQRIGVGRGVFAFSSLSWGFLLLHELSCAYYACLSTHTKELKFRRQNIFMSESLFVLGVSVNHHSRFFHSCADVTITNEALQFLTHARHSCPFNSKGSLTSHTYMYWDTRHPFIMVIPDSLALKLSLPVFTTVADGNRTKISRMQYLMTSRWCNITAF